jgi:uncharacterized protein (TIGR03546 family)
MIFLKILQKLIKLLHSEASPNHLAGGFALGSIIGLTALVSIQSFVIFILILMIKVNIGAAFLGMVVFGIVGHFTDPLSDIIGYYLLAQSPFLTVFWTDLYNMPLVPWTRFYNTIVLGSSLIALLLFIPVYFSSKRFVIYYRANLKEKAQKFKIVKLVKASRLFTLYHRYK